MENQLLKLALKRRSVRRYTNAVLDQQIIDEIMKVALTAPCSFGHMPVEFVVVRDKQRIKDLAGCKSLGGSQIIGADTVIVVMVKLDRGEFWIEDGAIASTYILLAAEQYDIGACWVHIRNRTGKSRSSDEEIRELLGVPEGYAVLNLVALGGKGENVPPYRIEDFDESKVHHEMFMI